ncbi:HesA/MoeB/ThiF family protein [Marinomonas sp.]|nr:HesA/MoeB/ThiF family protein [Marinomonas sp.]MDB4837723.1 HesA/MoeB/ThiF family protein [Marinomonas sp.]
MNEFELERYSRQLLLANFDVVGQAKLADSTILVIGLGGLGNIAATYLATAGVGHLVLADGDQLETSNLPRQVLYDEDQLGMDKVAAAAAQIRKKNSSTLIEIMPEILTGKRLENAIKKVDLVLDCTDNFAARKSVNRACLEYKKPLVSAAAIRWEGQLVSFLYDQGVSPCYECLYPSLSNEQLSCNESGVLSPVVGLLGVYQSLEALKVVSGCGEVKHGELKLFDGFSGHWRNMRLTKDPQCLACSVENQ